MQATAASAQHVSDNPVTSADDAYGLTLGLESVGLYSPGLVRGFSPEAAGNVRIDGLYFDEQGALSNRVVEGSVIRVGVTEIGYPFPAPTGVVDYQLRRAAGDGVHATSIESVGPYEGWGVSVDGSLPLAGKDLVLPIGVSTAISTFTPFGPIPGYTSRVTSVGAAPMWRVNERVTLRAFVDRQATDAAKTFPLYFTAGDFLPPAIPRGFLGQGWAQGRNVTTNFGGLVFAQLTGAWSLKAGLFRSENDSPIGYADLYTDIQPNGQARHLIAGFPDQNTASTSGEIRLTGRFASGDWRHQIIVMARGRDTTARYGGEDVVDEGAVSIDVANRVSRPGFLYSARTNDHAELWSVGSAYHLSWRKAAEVEVGVQDEGYRERVDSPGVAQSEVTAHPLRLYANAAAALGSRWTLYGGYTQGLEDSGVAPKSAANSAAVLPASLTWQADGGVRYAVTPKLKIIAGVFELEKPYFNLDTRNVDRALGVQRATGVELSVAGEPVKNLNVNIGVLDGSVRIMGPNLAAQGVGPIAVGQPRVMYVANASYRVPGWPAASLDVAATHFGTQPESVDNRVYTAAVTQTNVGGRYRFTAFGRENSLRLQVQNVFRAKVWTNVYTPGFFQWPGPRTVFAYLTTDW
jgi:iron complex outermembrane receptor protein